MTVSLLQTSEAAFPDRGGIGLEASMSGDASGAYLLHDLGAEHGVLHMRVLFNLGSAIGDAVTIGGAQTAGDAQAFALRVSPNLRLITVDIGGINNITGPISDGPSWHCLEVKLDAQAGEAALWINGVKTGTASGAFAGLSMRYIWLGGVAQSTSAAGIYYLDEWQATDDYIGVVTVPPKSSFADDPARWLVIYNAAEADARQWVETYRLRRGIPFANLLGLSLSSDEVISAEAYASLATAVNDYLTRHELEQEVLGIVAGYRVPGYVDVRGDGTELAPVASLLERPDTSLAAFEKPESVDIIPPRPTAERLGQSRLTARLDAPDLVTARAILDRADTLLDQGVGSGDQATLYFDPVAGESRSVLSAQWRSWAESVDRMRTRLPFARSDDGESFEDVNFTAVMNDGFVWAWPASEPPDPATFFQSPGGDRVLSLQLHHFNATATTARQTNVANWLQTPHEAGYAAAVAASHALGESQLPYPRPLFEALRQAWTLGEAWHVAKPWLRDKLQLLGDPLMTAALPSAGWNVYGPLNALIDLDPTQPSEALRADQKSVGLSANARPDDGQTAHYLVRRVDASGRIEANASPLRVTNVAGTAVMPPLQPVWPASPDWPVWVEAARVHLRIAWDRPIKRCRVETLELTGEIDGGEETTLGTWSPQTNQHAVATDQPLPMSAARFRWRLVSPGGAVLTTPWSTRVRPSDPATAELTLV